MNSFGYLINRIPDEVANRVETYITRNIAFFKPDTYIIGVNVEFEDYHIALPTSPLPVAVFDKTTHYFRGNRLIAINPGTAVLCKRETPTKHYTSFSVKKEFLAQIAQEIGLSRDVVFSKLDNPCSNSIRQAVSNFWNEKTHFNNALMLDSIAIQIIVYLLRETENSCNNEMCCSNDSANFVSEAEEYIRMFYHSNITLEDICQAIHVSPYHFIRTFKLKTGMTPHEYLLHIRIENAKLLLQKRECTVAQAAVMCGFLSVSHFSNVFKRLTGVSPLKYKRNYYFTE